MSDSIIYAIGDVHGMAAHLGKLLDYIKADARHYGKKAVVYFLGDITDRGPDSRGALQLVHDTLEELPGSVLHLGNHDLWFLEAIQTEGRGNEVASWEKHGGRDTMHSYFPGLKHAHALQGIRADYPHHVRVLREASLMTHHGCIVFCHAGVDRDVPLSRQHIGDLTWMREPFLSIRGSQYAVVVHGHTIEAEGPNVYDNRIALDTGAYASHRLTACRVDRTRRSISFIQTSGYGSFIEVDDVEPNFPDGITGSVRDRLDQIFDNWKE